MLFFVVTFPNTSTSTLLAKACQPGAKSSATHGWSEVICNRFIFILAQRVSTLQTTKDNLPEVFEQLAIGGDILAKSDPSAVAGALGLGLPDARLFSAALEQLCSAHGGNIEVDCSRVDSCCRGRQRGQTNRQQVFVSAYIYYHHSSECL